MAIERLPEEGEPASPVRRDMLASLDAYRRAAKYLSVGQIYLLANPLLREPLRPHGDGAPGIRDSTWPH